MPDEQTTNVIQLRPEREEPYSEATVQEAIRNLAHRSWKGMLEYCRNNPESKVAHLVDAIGPSRGISTLVLNWQHRNSAHGYKHVKTWAALDDIVKVRKNVGKFVKNAAYDSWIAAVERAIEGQSVVYGVRYPVTEEEKDRLRTFSVTAKAARLERLKREQEASAWRYQGQAEKKRKQDEKEARAKEAAARFAEREKAANAAAAAARVVEVVALDGVKRHRAVLSIIAGADPVSRLVKANLSPEDIGSAEKWGESERERLAIKRAAKDKIKAAEAIAAARSIEVPKFRHLKVARTKTSFRAVFVTTDKMTLKSARRRANLIYTARSRLKKHRLDFAETPERVEATCALTDYKKFFEVIAVLDQEIDECVKSRLTPQQVEQSLGISDRERLKWTKDGRLPTDGTDSFRKNGVTITFFLHPFIGISAISPNAVAKWRQDDLDATKAARISGAKKAVGTRARNDATRKSVRDEIDRMAREAGIHALSPVAVPVVKLAILTTICSRWAKNRRDADDRAGEAEFYELKDRGLRIIHAQPWTAVRFVPAGAPRYDVSLCERHRSDFRDERRAYEASFPEWIDDNIGLIRKCQNCSCHEDYDYYALYELRMAIGRAEFCWHVPYERGSDWLPDKSELEKAPPRSGDEGFVMFGRPVNDEEMIVWKPQKLKDEMETLLGLFEEKPALSAPRRPASRLPG